MATTRTEKDTMGTIQVPADRYWGAVAGIFAAFLRLGLTSFGGPIAHLGYFRGEFVERRRWLSEAGPSAEDLVHLRPPPQLISC